MGPTWISFSHSYPRVHPAHTPVCSPAHAASSSAEQQGTRGQQGGGGCRRGVKPQWFQCTSVVQDSPKTTASPSLVKCSKRDFGRSPENVLGSVSPPCTSLLYKGARQQTRKPLCPLWHQQRPAQVHCTHLYTDTATFSGQKKKKKWQNLCQSLCQMELPLPLLCQETLGCRNSEPSAPGRLWCLHAAACPWGVLRNFPSPFSK